MNPSVLAGSVAAGSWQLEPSQTDVQIRTDSFLLRRVPLSFTLHDSTMEINDEGEPSRISVDVSGGGAGDTHLDISFDLDERWLNGVHDDIVTGELVVAERRVPVTIELGDVDVDSTGDAHFTATVVVQRKDVGALSFLPSMLTGSRFTITIDATARPVNLPG